MNREIKDGQPVALRIAIGIEEKEFPGVIRSFDRGRGFISLEIEGKVDRRVFHPSGREVTILGRGPNVDLDIPCVVTDGSRFPLVVCRGVDRRNYLRVNTFLHLAYRPLDRTAFEADREGLLVKLREEMGHRDHAFEALRDELDSDTFDSRLLRILESLNQKIDRILSILEGPQDLESRGVVPVNLSGSGLRFTVKERMTARRLLAIRIVLPLCPPVPVVFVGEVQRVREKEDGEFEVAVKYVAIDESDREKIVHYAFKRMRESIRNRKNEEGEP